MNFINHRLPRQLPIIGLGDLWFRHDNWIAGGEAGLMSEGEGGCEEKKEEEEIFFHVYSTSTAVP